MIIAISTSQQTTNNNQCNSENIYPKCHPIVMSLEMLNYIAKIVAISANSVENQYSSVLQRIKNKQMHTMNGNRHKNPNVKSHLKIAKNNKGNSNFTTKLTNILSLIDK